jgi:hypothetical protein
MEGEREGTPLEPVLVTLAIVAIESRLEEVVLFVESLDK